MKGKVIFWSLKNSPNKGKGQLEEGIGCHVLSTIAKRSGYKTVIYQDYLFSGNPEDIARVTASSLSGDDDILAVSMLSTGIPLLGALVEDPRINALPIVVGGPGVTLEQDAVARILQGKVKYNAIVCGDGENAFAEILSNNPQNWRRIPGIGYAAPGMIHESSNFISSLEDSPLPDLSASYQRIEARKRMLDPALSLEDRLQDAKSLLVSQIESRRGCYYRCDFCNGSGLPVSKVRKSSPKKLVDGMESLFHEYGITFFSITDDVAFDTADWWKEFSRLLSGSDIMPYIKFGGYSAPAFLSKDDWLSEVIPGLYKVGMQGVILGVQAGSRRILKDIIHRPSNDPQNALKVVDALVPLGINVKTDFILGHPTETVDEIRETGKWVDAIYHAGGEVFVRDLKVLPCTGYCHKLADGIYSLPERTPEFQKAVDDVKSLGRNDDIYMQKAFADGKIPNKYLIDRKLGIIYPSKIFSMERLRHASHQLESSGMPRHVKEIYSLMFELAIKQKTMMEQGESNGR